MAHWIIHRPNEHCHPSEIRVAEQLKKLDEKWTILWGYYYRDAQGIDREGDFLVLGPAGGLLVLEVKNKLARWFQSTGAREGESENPIDQLMSEWSAIRRMVNAAGSPIWVAKALCISGEVASREYPNIQGIPRNLLVFQNDLENWIRTWIYLFGDKVAQAVPHPTRDRILAIFGASVQPVARRNFLDHTEQLFQRQLTTQFSLLDQLRDNRQLLVRGGTGTGKTWHALEQAFHYAQQADGQNVLFLVYNLALTAHLKNIVAMRKIDHGKVVVLGWEELFRSLADAGNPPPSPQTGASLEEFRHYYEVLLPQHVLALSKIEAARAKWPIFDALVVDEGQDHDTNWPTPPSSDSNLEPGGWWSIYQQLLRSGREAPASIFYDPAQRPPFRDPERFSTHSLASVWSQPVHLRLQPAVRYTRPLWSFFQTHRHPAINPMLEALGNGDHLPEGPPVERYSYNTSSEAVARITAILTRWKKDGLCEPEEVLILHKQSDVTRSALGSTRVLVDRNLREITEPVTFSNTIRHCSINKAKGLDARAVILLGLPPFEEFNDDFSAYTWFMGASRARQLLAVLEFTSPRVVIQIS
ncbi:MAG: hypothetical protein EAZ82_11435 [Verrucomicrobia bacterium]|nr:MAG: hypothetical protein EAZ82_11435 [Verrucomicrobiota bacterium]